MKKLTEYLPSTKYYLISLSSIYERVYVSIQGYFSHHIKIKWCKIKLVLKDDFSRSHLSHLCSLINKAIEKSNQIPHLVSIQLIFPFLTILSIPS